MKYFSRFDFFTEPRLCRFGPEQFDRPEAEARPKSAVDGQRRQVASQDRQERAVRERTERDADERSAEAKLNAELLHKDLTAVLNRHQPTLINWDTVQETAVAAFKEDARKVLGLPRNAQFLVTPTVDRGGVSLEVTSRVNPLQVHALFSRRWQKPVDNAVLNPRVADRPSQQVDAACRQLLDLETKLNGRPTTSKVTSVGDRVVIETTDQATGLVIGHVECDERGRIVRTAKLDADAVRRLTRPLLRDFEADGFRTAKLNPGETALLKQAALDVLISDAKEYLKPAQIEALRVLPILLHVDADGENGFKFTMIAKLSELELGVINYDRRVHQYTALNFKLPNLRKVLTEP